MKVKEVKLNAAGGNHCLNFKLSHEGQTPIPARIRKECTVEFLFRCHLVEPKQEKRVPARPVAGIRPRRWATRRSTEDFANINGFSTMGFIVLMTLSTHGHGTTFQDHCLGSSKRPCFPKFMEDGGSWCTSNGVTDGLMN